MAKQKQKLKTDRDFKLFIDRLQTMNFYEFCNAMETLPKTSVQKVTYALLEEKRNYSSAFSAFMRANYMQDKSVKEVVDEWKDKK